MRARLGSLLGLVLVLSANLGARDGLRLPWVFSDQPELVADFVFSPGLKKMTRVEMLLGGHFSNLKLPKGAARAPRLSVEVKFLAPGQLQDQPKSASALIDLDAVIQSAGLKFESALFSARSKLLYKGELSLDLAPGDYNVEVSVKDESLGIRGNRTLHLIVPEERSNAWGLSDLRVLLGVGERLDEQGKTQRVLDPNPWRELGGGSDWDFIVAYRDVGPRPAGALVQEYSVRRMRADEDSWSLIQPAPDKGARQVWLVHVPAQLVATWRPGVYLLTVALRSKSNPKQVVQSSKSFEVKL